MKINLCCSFQNFKFIKYTHIFVCECEDEQLTCAALCKTFKFIKFENSHAQHFLTLQIYKIHKDFCFQTWKRNKFISKFCVIVTFADYNLKNVLFTFLKTNQSNLLFPSWWFSHIPMHFFFQTRFRMTCCAILTFQDDYSRNSKKLVLHNKDNNQQ